MAETGKLYPPYIDGKIPAFCNASLRIPFRHNRSVGNADYQSMRCQMKTVSGNEWVWSLEVQRENIIKDPKTGTWYLDVDLSKINPATSKPYQEKLKIGLYYKVQVAYVSIFGTTGYFSDIGVTKYTSEPNIYIDGLKIGDNVSKYQYTGVYNQHNSENQKRDITEKAYSYCFTLYDEDGTVFDTSGEQIHNSSTDVLPYESRDYFKTNKELLPNKKYKIVYEVITLNDMRCSSPRYNILKKDSIRIRMRAKLEAKLDPEDGFIHVRLNGNSQDIISGNFVIARSSSEDNFETWNEIFHFTLNKETPIKDLFKDFTIQQGMSYVYSIQQYNARGLYSTRISSELVYADFEDMFLFDGEKQLRIRFNPTVQSFKTNILEQKMETIGGKYPFVFRNGKVYYKEFPIGGLISYLTDEQQYFLKRDNTEDFEYSSTDLSPKNILTERQFKLEVLDWLNDGNPKLFRSPTEGNYLVRIMNVSLSPNTTVARMLHSFSATAYEIDNHDFDTLFKYGMLKSLVKETSIMRFETIDLTGKTALINSTSTSIGGQNGGGQPNLADLKAAIGSSSIAASSKLDGVRGGAYLGYFDGVTAGSIIGIKFKERLPNDDSNIQLIRIGASSVYEVSWTDHENMIMEVYLVYTPNTSYQFDGSFTYGYYADADIDSFSEITDYEIEDKFCQFIGSQGNLIDTLEDIKNSVGRIYYMNFRLRDVEKCYGNGNRLYMDYGQQTSFADIGFNITSVYYDVLKDRYYSGKLLSERYTFNTPNLNEIGYWTEDDEEYKFYINNKDRNISLKTVERYIITNLQNVSTIEIGNMIVMEMFYQNCLTTYTPEVSGNAKSFYDAWIAAKGFVQEFDNDFASKITTSNMNSINYINGQYTKQSNIQANKGRDQLVKEAEEAYEDLRDALVLEDVAQVLDQD